MSPDDLTPYLGISRQLAVSKAEAMFLKVCTTPGWSLDDIDEATDGVLGDLAQSMREGLADQAQDPEAPAWQMFWAAVEGAFRERVAELVAAAGPQPSGTAQ